MPNPTAVPNDASHGVASAASAAAEVEDFQAFVATRGAHLYRTACLLTGGDTHLAEDLVQETLGRMYAVWGRRKRIDNPVGYAQTVLANVFIGLRRRRSSGEQPVAEVREVPGRGGDGDADLRLTLVAALARLSPQDRAVLVLRFWEDRSVEDTAAALRMGAGAVRSRSGRALARLREQLGADFPELTES
jgi:RNA polymerase sigma-70 factor (sigma-E family)